MNLRKDHYHTLSLSDSSDSKTERTITSKLIGLLRPAELNLPDFGHPFNPFENAFKYFQKQLTYENIKAGLNLLGFDQVCYKM